MYNSKCDSFSNRDERDKAVERIIANLAEEDIEATKTQITEKLTSLRSYYSGQRVKNGHQNLVEVQLSMYLLAHGNS